VARTDRHSAWNEVFALVLLFVGTLLFFALISYTPKDVPSWIWFSSHSPANRPAQNFIGPVGAIIAGICYQLMGAAAYLLAAILLGFGAAKLFHPSLRVTRRLVWIVLFIWSGACLLHLQPYHLRGWHAAFNIQGPGGWIGYAFVDEHHGLLRNALGPFGSLILLIGVYATTLVLVTGLRPIYLVRKKFVHIPPAGLGFLKQMFSREGLGALLRLAIVYVFVAVFWSLWDQSSGGSWTLQAQHLDLHWFGMDLLPSQVQTANPILILLFIPLVNYVIYPFIDRFFLLTPLRKIGIGLFLTAASYVVIWYIQQMIDAGGKPSVNWQFLAYIILTLGETMVSITGLEFSYTQAPNKMKSAVMALWLFTVSMGNLFTAAVNYFIRNPDGTVKMNDQQYFLFFAVLMLVAGVIFVVVAMFYRGKTYLQSQEKPLEELEPAAVTEVGMP